MFSDDGHEHRLSPPHNKINDADYGDSQCRSSIQESGLQLCAISKSLCHYAIISVASISRSPSVTAFIKFLSGIPFSLKPSATTKNIDCPVVFFPYIWQIVTVRLISLLLHLEGEGIELHFRYSSYHPEASTPRNPLFFSGQLSLFITPNPLWESLL
ncbi:hypothetical protein T05_3285 [Trichinella murrelli]|uniref:Uncharacterized protein n=1 Tax=Trichinella murrelli TaxID=144512 RepID=A0A0V0T8Q9_9BILA|nr:hypothetical protein T05_3285 [Trichinella murrelli]